MDFKWKGVEWIGVGQGRYKCQGFIKTAVDISSYEMREIS